MVETGEAFIAELRKQLPDVSVVTKADEGYADARAEWNIRTQYLPVAVVQPRNAEEVSAILKLAARHDVGQIAVRSGTHSFEGLSLGGKDTSAVVIDMIKLSTIESNPDEAVLVAGGGALLGHVYQHAWDNGQHMIPMGSCLGVGLSGQVQAGGYGHYVRAYGILTDRALGFEVVTADGEIRQVSESEHPDLFFALRGSGTGSFGVITKVRLRTNPAPKAVANFTVRWKLESIDIGEVLKKVQAACLNAPKTFTPMIVIWQGILEVAGSILVDTAAEHEAIWREFLAPLPKPDVQRLTPLSFIDSVNDLASTQTSAPWSHDPETLRREGAEHLRYMKIKAGFMPEVMTDEFLDELGRYSATQPRVGVRIQILGLDPDRTPVPDTTSVKVRSCPWLMGMSVWLTAADSGGVDGATRAGEERLPWLNGAYELFYPYTSGGYIGDDDLDEAAHGRDIYDSYFGRHLPRLVDVKQTYDPHNRFHHPLSIPTELPAGLVAHKSGS